MPYAACATTSPTAPTPPASPPPQHRKRLSPSYEQARTNPLWPPLEAILEAQGGLDADQRQFILLVTVLVAFIESCARLQQPFQPHATVRFSGGS